MPLAYGLIQPVNLALPGLPQALDGLRIAHVTDLHVRRWNRRLSQLVNQLTSLRLDLVAFTGDYQHLPPHHDAAVEVLQRLTRRLRPSLGCFGVFGNHDEAPLGPALADLPVRWLDNDAVALDDRPVEVLGLNQLRGVDPDAVALAIKMGHRNTPADAPDPPRPAPDRPFRVALCHSPDFAHGLGPLGADLTLCGHTHGGQLRWPWRRSLVNSTDLPQWMSSGAFRRDGELWCISRGLGESGPPFRAWCPPHVPVYTLRRRTGPTRGGDDFHAVLRW